MKFDSRIAAATARGATLFGVALCSGCIVAKTAGGAVSATGKAAKTTVKAGGAAIDAGVDIVDADEEEDREED